MAKWTVNYSDSVEVEARTEDEAIRKHGIECSVMVLKITAFGAVL